MTDKKDGGFLALGIGATVLIVLFVLGYSSLHGFEAYIGWVAFVWMTAVPAQIIFGLHMHFMAPARLAGLRQPLKGLAYLGLTAVLMLAGGAFLYLVPGGASAPGPFLIMATIISIVATFWLVGAWGCWPFTLVSADPFKQGLMAVVAAYGLGFAGFRLAFDFSFMAGAPVYVAALDPHGAFGAWTALAFAVTTVAVMMCQSLFGFWPATRLAAKQPGLGLVVTLLNLVLSAGLFWLMTAYLGMDMVDYLVRVPVSIIFGVFIAANMMQFRLFETVDQPKRGLMLLVVTLVLAWGMQLLYRFAMPYVTGTDLPSGAPGYAAELWIATALLGVTFPVINLVSGYFGFWPARRG
ncbi:MAG: hypothetical protein EP335_00805 [Alphaproteobacteria bacterium]|nr:MAG: hypothetical protein EP335_00805 [Alphaproteobacteria bacterium]